MEYQDYTKEALIEIMVVKDKTIDCLEKRICQLGSEIVRLNKLRAKFALSLLDKFKTRNEFGLNTDAQMALNEAERILRECK